MLFSKSPTASQVSKILKDHSDAIALAQGEAAESLTATNEFRENLSIDVDQVQKDIAKLDTARIRMNGSIRDASQKAIDMDEAQTVRADQFAAAMQSEAERDDAQDARLDDHEGRLVANDVRQSAQDGRLDALDASKAALEGPALRGSPSAPTAEPGTNSTQLATTAFVHAAMKALMGGVTVDTLDTIQEIAEAIGNDPQLAKHLSAQIAAKQDKSPILTALAGLAIVEGQLLIAKANGQLEGLTTTAAGRGLIQAADGAAARTAIGAASAADVEALKGRLDQAVRAPVTADGSYLWKFPVPYPANVVPVVTVTAEKHAGRPTMAYLDAPATNTQVLLRASRTKLLALQVLGVSLDAFEVVAAVYVNARACSPS